MFLVKYLLRPRKMEQPTDLPKFEFETNVLNVPKEVLFHIFELTLSKDSFGNYKKKDLVCEILSIKTMVNFLFEYNFRKS